MENAEAEKALALMLERGGDDGSVGAKYLAAMGLAPEKEKQDNIERTRVFSASAIKRIGFDPSGQRYEDPEKRVSSNKSLADPREQPSRRSRKSPHDHSSSVARQGLNVSPTSLYRLLYPSPSRSKKKR